MVKLIKKLLLELSNGLVDEKKVITIGKEDHQNINRDIYYISNVYGEKRYGKKWRIKKAEYEKLTSQAKNIQILRTY